MSTPLEIDSQDVIRLILQFLKENGLTRSLNTLQEESHVTLDVVDSVDTFVTDVQGGKWDTVLQTVGFMNLQEDILHTLYDQVACEMIELKETECAKMILKDTSAMQSMKLHQPERYRKLEGLINKQIVDPKELYEGTTKDKRRILLSQALSANLKSAPPSRLLALIGMALKWQQYQGLLPKGVNAHYDLFRGVATREAEETEHCVQEEAKVLKFGKKSYAESAIFSPNGELLITGSVDGIIEVWDACSGVLRKDLEYQANDKMMFHEKAVLALAISRDSEILASGSASGQVKVWQISNGECRRRFDKAHEQGITSIQFSKDSTQLLTTSFDHTARMHGLKSGKTLRVFPGHTSYVNCGIFTADASKVVTASSDGKIKIWDAKTAELLQTFIPPPPPHMNPSLPPAVHSIFLPSRTSNDLIYVCTKSNTFYLMTLGGQVLKTFSSGKREGGDFVAATVSPKDQWIYCDGEDNTLYCFSTASGKLEHVLQVHDKDVIGLQHHPRFSLVASWGVDGKLVLLKK